MYMFICALCLRVYMCFLLNYSLPCFEIGFLADANSNLAKLASQLAPGSTCLQDWSYKHIFHSTQLFMWGFGDPNSGFSCLPSKRFTNRAIFPALENFWTKPF